jgi:hypothetical protein
MPPLELPPEVEAVFREFRTCEFTTVNRQRQPLTWPIEPFYRHSDGRLIVTSSIAFPVKAHNARRHSKVALLFSDPTGSGLEDPPAVLVHGDATVEELTGDPDWSYEMFKESVLRQPNTRKFVGNPIAQRLFLFQYQRLAVITEPRRLLIWPHGDFSALPTKIEIGGSDEQPGGAGSVAPAEQDATPAFRAWNKALVACARVYSSGVLTVVEPSGYPVSVRCQVHFDDAREVVTLSGMPAQVPGGWQGKACLLFHRHDKYLGDQHELLIKGTLNSEGDTVTFLPGEFLSGSGSQKTDTMPVSGSPMQMIQFMMLGRRKSKEYLAKRGEPWPPRPFKKMVRYLDVGPAALQED